MPRALFEKAGNARYISHLDLMRVFQRAFKRAGLPLTHTQGFNPRPSVSIALPLSLGVESQCELLDFELERPYACAEIREKLNAALIDGGPDAPPNDMRAGFGGSAWEYVPELGQWYFHQFAPEQPDLNWYNPALRQELYRVLRFWVDKGVPASLLWSVTRPRPLSVTCRPRSRRA